MDFLICNKCYAPINRGKQPYHITQCAHIYCQSCLQEAEKECPQCGYVGSISIPLKEPLMPKVAPFFAPLTDTLELLHKVDMVKSNQIKIMTQRFYELDKKYEMLKGQYFTLQRKAKEWLEKFNTLKSEKEKLEKKLMFSEIQRHTPHSSTSSLMKTPADSSIFTNSSNARYSSEPIELSNSVDMMSRRSTNPIKQRIRTSDGFRVPNNCRPLRSINSSLNTPDRASNFSFMRQS